MSQWTEGAEVVERASTWGSISRPYYRDFRGQCPTYRYGTPTKIAKVYKNGNFIVDGSTQQWSPRSDHASKTGQYGSTNYSMVLVTSEVRADMARSKAYEVAFGVVKKEAERLDRLWRGKDVDATLAEAAAIAERSK